LEIQFEPEIASSQASTPEIVPATPAISPADNSDPVQSSPTNSPLSNPPRNAPILPRSSNPRYSLRSNTPRVAVNNEDLPQSTNLPWVGYTSTIKYAERISKDNENKDQTLEKAVEIAVNYFLASEQGSKTISEMYLNNASAVFATRIVKNKRDPRFTEAKKKELQALIAKGTYEFVKEKSINPGETILQSRFVLTIKNFNEKDEYFKARLVILGHVDPDKPRVVCEAPTVLKSSVRLLLSLAATYGFKIWSRDISQAFIQSDEPLRRTVYVKPPKGENVLDQIGAPKGSMLKAIKPQYGLPESPGYWWKTFKRWHENDLGMKPTALDPCFFYKHDKDQLHGIQVTQVDDTLGSGIASFSNMEITKSKKFECKPRSQLLPMKFNGIWIEECKNGGYKIHQNDYCASIKLPTSPENYATLQSLRGKIAYAATSTRPDVSFPAASLSQVTESGPFESAFNLLKKSIKALSVPRHIVFLPLDKDSIYIGGYVSTDLQTILGRKISTEMYTDSKSLFDTITKLSTVSEKRMLIDVAAIRESYASGEIRNVAHILSKHNIANPFTKENAHMEQLHNLMKTGYLDHPINQWIVEPPKRS